MYQECHFPLTFFLHKFKFKRASFVPLENCVTSFLSLIGTKYFIPIALALFLSSTQWFALLFFSFSEMRRYPAELINHFCAQGTGCSAVVSVIKQNYYIIIMKYYNSHVEITRILINKSETPFFSHPILFTIQISLQTKSDSREKKTKPEKDSRMWQKLGARLFSLDRNVAKSYWSMTEGCVKSSNRTPIWSTKRDNVLRSRNAGLATRGSFARVNYWNCKNASDK